MIHVNFGPKVCAGIDGETETQRRYDMTHKQFSTTLFGMVAGLLVAALISPVTGTAAQNKIRGIMAEQILEMDVRTQDGEDVGEIDDVVFDRQGKLKDFIIDVSGFLGIGDKQVAVSTKELKYDSEREYAIYQGSREDLENKPEADFYAYRTGPGSYWNRPYLDRGYNPHPDSYYRDPYYYAPYPYAPYPARQYPPRGRGYYSRDFDRQNGNMNRQRSESFREGGPNQGPNGGHGRYPAYPGRWRAENGDLLMSAIINATVRSNRGENIGNIENLVVNRRGQITYAITEVGGFLGIGDKKVAVPFNDLQNLGRYFAMYPGTEDQLESIPAFDKSQIVGRARGWSGKTAEGQQQKSPNKEEAKQSSDEQNAKQMKGQEQQ